MIGEIPYWLCVRILTFFDSGKCVCSYKRFTTSDDLENGCDYAITEISKILDFGGFRGFNDLPFTTTVTLNLIAKDGCWPADQNGVFLTLILGLTVDTFINRYRTYAIYPPLKSRNKNTPYDPDRLYQGVGPVTVYEGVHCKAENEGQKHPILVGWPTTIFCT